MAAALALAGCTASPPAADPPPTGRVVPAGGLRLVAFDGCDEALRQLRTAAKAAVGPWGLGPDVRMQFSAERAAVGGAAKDAASASTPDFSGTNVHEAGVDEPDLVKTDGRRIVTVSRGVLSVVDPASRRVTGRLALDRDAERFSGDEGSLLLHGDRALVLLHAGRTVKGPVPDGQTRPGATPQARLVLVDLAGPPRVVGEYRMDGLLVDARQSGGTARVVIRSAPRLDFPYPSGRRTDAQRIAANRAVIDKATLDDWLPRYEIRDSVRTVGTGRVGCDRVNRPAGFSGASMVTVLSFDLGAAALGAGDPVTVVADGDTVYSNGARLYVANDHRWRMWRGGPSGARDTSTEIYQFDTAAGTPRFVAAGSVPGWLINQYALSEWDGHLRVATTTGDTWGRGTSSQSGVYVLRADGATLKRVGAVTGLGKGERIFAVRFVGGTGYVVTFRQTDPLYGVDLRDPAAPRVTGELKINGYSAYLHPAGDGRLIGVGQDATDRGRVTGTQVSLFDVADPARPARIAQHHVPGGWSEAEHDPHAFLYWEPERLVVLPVRQPGVVTDRADGTRRPPSGGVLALRIGDKGFTVAGAVDHPGVLADGGEWAPIRRSLMIDGVLWTVSDAGLKATALSGMTTLGWVPLT
ncbi:beta-propeller domain-containing protein [Micromonospora aurantiaca (nom. illeg.)]|uniref:Benzoate transporter n=1 Tax=Micromonospora aurantiaca (nom. illeg.) TaxID=47850 RepID=A0ABQ6UKP9_9ACTN|nr:beta-propeller domain-containing protein [Micromonospora aurantiaca]KAB1117638.1 benzoate transporter [Micromonospora aurantiaca]UFN97391.1 beta-propeller domain-containing protein [Micromonospora aurantiaca]